MPKSLWLITLVSISCLAFFTVSLHSPVYAERGGLSDPSPSQRRWICQTAVSPDGSAHFVTIVDPDLGSMAVYQVDKSTGDIELRSVRKIEWDLVLEEYNGCKSSPHPAEIRAMLKRPSR